MAWGQRSRVILGSGSGCSSFEELSGYLLSIEETARIYVLLGCGQRLVKSLSAFYAEPVALHFGPFRL